MTTKQIFHVSDAPLATPIVLTPGNWGKRTRAFSTNTLISAENRAVLLWETLLEMSRRHIRPVAVSRLNCVFACDSLEAATYFRNKSKSNSFIFEAETSQDTPMFRGNLQTLDFDGRIMPLIDWNIERCQQYWREEGVGARIEILCGGPITVLRRIEENDVLPADMNQTTLDH